MGIYDRDYYREDGPRWAGAVASAGTIGLIALTIGLFFAQVLSTPHRARGAESLQQSELQAAVEFQYDKVARGEVWRVFTAGVFPDMSLFTLIISMLLLYWAGKELERVYGTRPFVAFFLLAGLAGTLGKLLLGLAGIDTGVPSVGIGAAIFATMVLFACLNPRRTILVFFVLPMPIALLVGLLLALAVFGMLRDGTNVHAVGTVVGAVFGFLFFRFAPAVLNWSNAGRTRTARRPAIRLHTSPPEVEYAAPPPKASRPSPPVIERQSQGALDEQLEAKLDRVLGKVAQFGRGSLTAEELEILQQASEIYKRKRS